MKKQRFFMLGIITVLVAVLSLTFVSSTFAKYTSSNSGFDTARVAKWGVEVAVNAETFTKAYGTTVESTTDDVVAPGTAGELTSITVTGTPEVAVRVSYAATLELGDAWTVSSAYYCPLVIDVNGTKFKGTNYASAAEFKAAVENAINSFTNDYDPNENLNQVDDDLTISWSWEYFTSDENDIKDTALGDNAANGNAATIKLTLAVTVEQID